METAQQLIAKLDAYGFECEAGPLKNCVDYLALCDMALAAEAKLAGGVVVPREPTEEMARTFFRVRDEYLAECPSEYKNAFRAGYFAMLTPATGETK